jgi:hypothetical protein
VTQRSYSISMTEMEEFNYNSEISEETTLEMLLIWRGGYLGSWCTGKEYLSKSEITSLENMNGKDNRY